MRTGLGLELQKSAGSEHIYLHLAVILKAEECVQFKLSLRLKGTRKHGLIYPLIRRHANSHNGTCIDLLIIFQLVGLAHQPVLYIPMLVQFQLELGISSK